MSQTMRPAVCILLASFAGVAVGELDTTCWEEHNDMYIPCAAGQSAVGDMDERMAECISLGSGCTGVTCKGGNQGCTARYHLKDGCTVGGEKKFLEHSSEGETSYVKICALKKVTFERQERKELTCTGGVGDDQFSLLEMKIKCADQLSQCAAVVCIGDVETTQQCSIRPAGRCRDFADRDDATTFVMTEKSTGTPPAPGTEECVWSSHIDEDFTCGEIESAKLVSSLDIAKQACIDSRKNAKGTMGFCNGIVCSGEFEQDSTLKCAMHTHCMHESGEPRKAKVGTTVFVPKCSQVAFCNDPCHIVQEYTAHVCQSDCDCEGFRTCRDVGYCSDPSNIDTSLEACREGDNCVFEYHKYRYVSCYANGLQEEMDLAAAKKLCVQMGRDCAAVTCDIKSGKCSVRNHAQSACNDGYFLRTSPSAESYVKCCGMNAERYCPGAFAMGPVDVDGGDGSEEDTKHALVIASLITLAMIVLVVGIIACLAYNRRVGRGTQSELTSLEDAGQELQGAGLHPQGENGEGEREGGQLSGQDVVAPQLVVPLEIPQDEP